MAETLAPERSGHILVVGACQECSVLDDHHCGRAYRDTWQGHSFDVRIECPEDCAERCWQECGASGCPAHYLHSDAGVLVRTVDEGDDEPVFHGVAHSIVNGSWMRQVDACWSQQYDNLSESAEHISVQGQGRYLIEFRDDGDGYMEIELIPS